MTDKLPGIDWGFYAFAMSVPFMLLSAVIVIAVDWLIDLPACLVSRSRLCSRSKFGGCAGNLGLRAGRR
jgi:hypothetical protein